MLSTQYASTNDRDIVDDISKWIFWTDMSVCNSTFIEICTVFCIIDKVSAVVQVMFWLISKAPKEAICYNVFMKWG